jgi:hypothetical protein
LDAVKKDSMIWTLSVISWASVVREGEVEGEDMAIVEVFKKTLGDLLLYGVLMPLST